MKTMNKIKRKAVCSLLVFVCAFALLLGGCADETEADVNVYYLNIAQSGLETSPYDLTSTGTVNQVNELLAALQEAPESDDFISTIPSALQVENTVLGENGELELYFGREYENIEGVEEVLIRSAIVRTLLQLPGVSSVAFYVSNEPLAASDGTVIGAMTEDSFVDYGDTSTSAMQRKVLTLYYASADGQKLIREKRTAYYSSNIALEKLVMEYLLESPQTDGAQSAIPAETKILNIAVSDGICYVNLDSNFLATMDNVSSQVSVYAIVNSLTELPGISKVQISVEGEVENVLLNGTQLSNLYERNMDLVSK